MYRGLRCLKRCLCYSKVSIAAINRTHATHFQGIQTSKTAGFIPSTNLNRTYHRYRVASSYSGQQEIQDGEQFEEVEIELPPNCPGCGVRLQGEDPVAPGFFQVPKKIINILSNPIPEEDLVEDDGDNDENEEDARDWDSFDSMVESWIDEADKKRPQVPAVKVYAEQETAADDILSNVLCARCYSLQHYGRVKSEEAESSLPGFNFEKSVGHRIALQKFRRSIVLVVVDLADFDGSLPRDAVKSLLPSHQRNIDMSDNYPSDFRLVIAANKADLLPTKATKLRLESWVRRRMNQGGMPRPSAVHVVSSEKGTGIKALLADVQAAVGSRGDVWVVGAQNAGKSSLINAMRRSVGLKTERKITTAPLPGTTLGVVQVPSLLPTGCKMLDTPGVPHSYQLGKYMTSEEMKMLLPRRPLKPRTYRIGADHSLALGGVARVDVLDCPGATLYLTVWASDLVVSHFGKTAGAEERYQRHAGLKLVPPVAMLDVDQAGDDEDGDESDIQRLDNTVRMGEFPKLCATDVEVVGDSWQESSMDVAIAGLGWIGVGVSGDAKLRVWAPPGVAITTRYALLPDYAKDFERPGFSVGDVAIKKNIGKGGGGLGGKMGKGKKRK